ncbi:MAG: penicillin-binding protein, partial [Clostridia bacterium]|nr:penicillin-binding protein [Clostridia bacterium]
PIQSYENAFKRKNTVLKTMYDNEYIDKPLYNATLKEEIKLVESKNNNYIYPYVKATLNEFNSKVLVNPYVSGTVKIYTYLDLSLQNYVYNLNANTNYKYSRQQIVKNNKNNGIIAYFGENSNIERSPASCIKPWYVYAPLINEKLITESTVIIDEETNFNGYTPKNYANKYYGAVTTKTAISKSLNVPSVKLLSNYGFEIANEYANKLNVQVNGDNLAVALGATNTGVTLKKLADTYTVFANNGNYLESSFINKVSINNTPIYERNLNFNKVFSDETAYIISDTLNDSVLNGTSKKLYDKNYKIYAKTGTNGNENGNLDAYTICYTSEHTVAVWLGNYDNSLMDNAITGGTYPAVYTKYTLDYLYKNNYPTQIELPSGIVSVNINENELLNNQTELIDNENGVNFYYVKGTEPTKYKNSEITPKIKNAVIKVSNNNVSINLESENANEFIINRCCNKNKTTFNATTFSFFDEKLNNGIYYYEITPVFNNNGNKILGKPYVTPSIKINKTIVNDWWKE